MIFVIPAKAGIHLTVIPNTGPGSQIIVILNLIQDLTTAQDPGSAGMTAPPEFFLVQTGTRVTIDL
jgi:hypothetical protein